MGITTDYRLTADELRTNYLPQELEAYPYYPEGTHIPISQVGTIILTDDAEYQLPAVTLGVYNYEMDGVNSNMLDVPPDRLESVVIWLMTAIRHTEDWCREASIQLDAWRNTEGWR